VSRVEIVLEPQMLHATAATPHQPQGLYAYPDLVVVCGPSQYHDQARDVLLNPTVIVEVLSPSTEAIDRGDKLYRYRRWLPTLMDYVLVAQDRLVIDHYQRTTAGSPAPQEQTSAILPCGYLPP